MAESFVRFVPGEPKPKTLTWRVLTAERRPLILGEIKWYSQWRCYAFFPTTGTLYEKRCLRDIANFCEKATADHRVRKGAVNG